MRKILTLMLSLAIFASCNNPGTDKATNETKEDVNVTAVKTVGLRVTGMTCEGCENTVKEALNKIEGVTESNASFATNQAKVSYDTTKTNIAEISKTIDELGYKFEGLE